jgi:hypothetical protein
MDTFLLSLGWWNFGGSITMLFFLNEKFGNKILNEWTKIFATEFKLDYWGKLWLVWAAGINIFFGLINILSVKWGYIEVKEFLIYCDLVAYFILFSLAVWGWQCKRMGSGVYSVFIVFMGWMVWGIYSLI